MHCYINKNILEVHCYIKRAKLFDRLIISKKIMSVNEIELQINISTIVSI